MDKAPVRRAQLIAPFGVGAMMVLSNGTSVITAGLDHWYKRESGNKGLDDISEYKINEWRLQRTLHVGHFRLPPDFREKYNKYSTHIEPNEDLTIPVLRFPQWTQCTNVKCRNLERATLTNKQKKTKCRKCKFESIQVQFVAICDRGHIRDFPWREWVHQNHQPVCNGELKLYSTGSTTLASQIVECLECPAKRTLSEITNVSESQVPILSEKLESGFLYLCQGHKPWLGYDEQDEKYEPCGRPLKGSLRSASNVYYADIKSSIFIPINDTDETIKEILELFEKKDNSLSARLSLLAQSGVILSATELKKEVPSLAAFTDENLETAIKIAASGHSVPDDDDYTAFRREEYETLRITHDKEDLRVKELSVLEYSKIFQEWFSKCNLITRLRETRVLTGFTRILPENDYGLDERKSLLRRTAQSYRDSWLPAIEVFGEGIYLELNENLLSRWEKNQKVIERLSSLNERYVRLQSKKKVRLRPIGPRFLLVHTLAHILINQLVFECGYSTASLRERLFISENSERPMSGLLIYTAAGDSEGTMGGLVRMGKPKNFEPILMRALEKASWCSVDPVCMEIGARGQGPESLNLATCHNCGLLPETACEEFNQFLDRGVLVGDLKGDSKIGYFERAF